MLFMCVYTWKPEQSSEVIKRLREGGHVTPEGVEIIGWWADVGKGRSYAVIETDDIEAMLLLNLPWADVMEADIVPVMKVEGIFEDVQI